MVLSTCVKKWKMLSLTNRYSYFKSSSHTSAVHLSCALLCGGTHTHLYRMGKWLNIADVILWSLSEPIFASHIVYTLFFNLLLKFDTMKILEISTNRIRKCNNDRKRIFNIVFHSPNSCDAAVENDEFHFIWTLTTILTWCRVCVCALRSSKISTCREKTAERQCARVWVHEKKMGTWNRLMAIIYFFVYHKVLFLIRWFRMQCTNVYGHYSSSHTHFMLVVIYGNGFCCSCCWVCVCVCMYGGRMRIIFFNQRYD